MAIRRLPLRMMGALLGYAMVIDSAIHLEWSFPYCRDMFDGPLYALYGFPVPYITFGGVSSLEYSFSPAAYLVDIVVISLVLALVVWPVRARLPEPAVRVIQVFGWIALVGVVAWRGVLIGAGMWRPSIHVITAPYVTYAELKPVGLSRDLHYDCRPLP